jgi:hypothetical protein
MNLNQTYDRLLPIIAQIDKSIIAQSVTDNGNSTYTFLVAKTKWATKGFNINVLTDSYLITDVIFNQSITVKGSVLPSVLTFDLYAPIFKHGTVKTVASELNNLPSLSDRLPLIFLQEIVQEQYHFDQIDAIDTDADVRLTFLIDTNFEDWIQTDADTLAIKPMRALCNEFIKVLANNQYVAELTGIGNVRNYKNFGSYDDKGVIKNLFNEFLSGVQLRITIPFFKECDCCDDSTLDNRPAPGYVIDPLGNILAVLYSNEYYTSTGGTCEDVSIIDQNDNIIATVQSGGTYPVTVLTTIRDTIDANTSTIIDNLT